MANMAPPYHPAPPVGLICPLVTPLCSGPELDSAGLRSLVEHVSAHADGILVGSPWWGEGIHLPLELKKHLIRESWEYIPAGIPLLVDVTGKDLGQTWEMVSWIMSWGEEIKAKNPLFLACYPLWYHSNRKLPQHLQELTGKTGLPLVIGNDPLLIKRLGRQVKHLNMRTSVVKKMGPNGHIKALIFSGEIKRLFNYRRALQERSDFLFYDGEEERFLSGPNRAGVVSVGSNIFPRQWSEITAASMHPEKRPQRFEQSKARDLELSHCLKDLCLLYRNNPPAVIKYALTVLGVVREAETASKEGPPLSEDLRKKVESYLKKVPEPSGIPA